MVHKKTDKDGSEEVFHSVEIKEILEPEFSNKTAINMENVQNDSHSKRAIDFSYIEELSGGDQDFKFEMIKLFIQSIPEDLNKLEDALKIKDTPAIAKLAHHMKSSLSMFKLDKEVEFLSETEKNAKASLVKDETLKHFTDFKLSLAYVTGLLLSMSEP